MTKRRRTLPPVSPKVPAEMRPLMAAMAEILETGEGVRGDPLDRKLTLRDLLDSGLAGLKPGARPGAPGGLVPPPGQAPPDMSVPPRPQELAAHGSFYGMINLSWRDPGQLYGNHAFANVYRSEEDNFANAEVVGRAIGNFYSDFVRDDALDPDDPTQLQGYYYWITFVSAAGVEGPPSAGEGTYAQPIADAGYVIELLTGQIDETLLAQTLREEIEKIDIHDHRFDDVESRLDDERDRLDGRIDEARDNADAISNRLDDERDRIDGRVDGALQNVDQVDARVDETRSRLESRVDELRGEIVDVDTSAAERVAEERDARLAALSEEAAARGSEIDAERVARVAAIQAEAEEREERFLKWEADYELENGLYAAQMSAVAAAYRARAATIYSLEEVRITDREVTATRIDGMEVRLDDTEASITQEQVARANADSALASQISVLSAKIDALPTFANGFEAGLEFDRWVTEGGHGIEAETEDPFAGDQSALISSTISSVDTSEAPFAISSRIPSGTADAFAARRLRVSLAARQVDGGSGEFAVGYAIADQWFSGWTMFTPGAGWTIFEATVEVPDDVAGDHYVVLWGDTSGGGGAVEVDRLLVDVADSEIPEITAQIDALQQVIADNEQAMAQQLTQLESQFGGSLASLDQDIQTISDETSALGQQISTVDARVDTSRALIQDESQSRADADSALASDIQTLTATTGDLAADIQSESQARADGDEALAADITDLWAGVDENEARITDEANVRATEDELLAGIQRVISASKGASSATTISLEEVRLEKSRVVATRFNALEGEVESAKGAISDIESLTLSSDSALITRFSEVEGRVGDSEGAITRIEDLDLDPGAALITRFSEAEGRLDNAEGAISDIESLDISPESALITRFSEVESRVGVAEGAISDIQDLNLSPNSVLMTRFFSIEGRVDGAESGLAAAQGAITAIEDLNLSPSSALINRFIDIEGRVDGAEGAISSIESLDISPDSALITRFAEIEGRVGTAEGAITDIEDLTISPESALVTRFTTTEARVENAEGAIEEESRVRAAEDELLSLVQRVVSASKGASSAATISLEEVRLEDRRVTINRLEAIEGEVEGAKGAIADIENLDISPSSVLATRLSEIDGEIGEAKGSIKDIEDLTLSSSSALIGRFESIQGSVDDAQGAINDIRDLNIGDGTALASRLSGLEASIGDVEAGASQQLSSEVERIDGEISAVSQAVTQVQADTGDEFAAVRQELSTEISGVTGELNALWNVRVTGTSADGEQVLGGIGLGTEGDTVDVVFDVDRVAFGRTNAQGRKPFIMDGGQVYLDEVMIRQGAIQEGQLGPITIGKLFRPDGTPITTVGGLIRADAIDVNNLSVAEAARFSGDVTSTNYSPGSSGWIIMQNGYVEFNDAVIRGNVDLTTLSVNGESPTSGFALNVTSYNWSDSKTVSGSFSNTTIYDQSITRSNNVTLNEVPAGATVSINVFRQSSVTARVNRRSVTTSTPDPFGNTTRYDNYYRGDVAARLRIRVRIDGVVRHETDHNLSETLTSSSLGALTLSTPSMSTTTINYTYPSYRSSSVIRVEVYARSYSRIGEFLRQDVTPGASGSSNPGGSGTISISSQQSSGNLSRI